MQKSHAALLIPFGLAARHPGQEGQVAIACSGSVAVNALLHGFFFLCLSLSSNGSLLGYWGFQGIFPRNDCVT